VYHQVSDNPPRRDIIHVEDSAITAGAFKKQLSQIHESGIKVLPIAAAYANLEQQ
jgi:hypothetical protein